MAHYWGQTFICPYYQYDDKLKITCEDGCKIVFKDRKDAKKYIDTYCASFDYKKCSIAAKNEEWYKEKYNL